jgi:TonB family protein
MKNNIVTLLWLLSIPCFAQDDSFQLGKRMNPVVKMEKLKTVAFVGELSPELWPKMNMPYNERYELDRRSINHGYYNYHTLVDYVLVRISTTRNGKTTTAVNTGSKLSDAQKRILQSVESGEDIAIEIAFRYKTGFRAAAGSHVIRGRLALTAVPEHEAEFPYKDSLSLFLKERVLFIAKQTGLGASMMQAIVTFTVTEHGQVSDAVIVRTTTDKKADELLREAILSMPKWIPASNAAGFKVKQRYTVRLSADGC